MQVLSIYLPFVPSLEFQLTPGPFPRDPAQKCTDCDNGNDHKEDNGKAITDTKLIAGTDRLEEDREKGNEKRQD